FYELGKTSANIDGTILSIYDRERTICDCFKYRTKLDNELFNKAVRSYVDDEQKNLINLSKYAKEMGLLKKINDLMEVMLNG
ncbi:MAG: type IV toxin-antitoxin system AbiEi family antitoxin domain-containing protein, partial [Holdemania filiformis]